MFLDDPEVEWEVLREPLECCGGQRAIAAATHAVNGKSLHITFVQHELWCACGPPIPD